MGKIEKLARLAKATLPFACGLICCGHYLMNMYRYPQIFGIDISEFAGHPIALFSNIGMVFVILGISTSILCVMSLVIFLIHNRKYKKMTERTIEQEAKQEYCISCGKEVELTDNYCGDCGEKLD